MIEVVLGALTDGGTAAILRPVASDWTPVTPAMGRLDRLAGPAVAEQCRRLGELPVGSAAITAAGPLPAEFMVHVVVRSTEERVSTAVVRRALLNGLRRLAEWDIESVALPLLGTGAGNLDAEEASEAMIPVLLEHAREGDAPARIRVLCENDYERETFARRLAWHRGRAPAAGGCS